MSYYECKAHYIKRLDNGTDKPVNEPYMVNAMSVTEAEARVIEKLSPTIYGDVTVVSVTKSKIADVFGDEQADYFYRAKLALIVVDEVTAVEKRSPVHILIRANSFDRAYKLIGEWTKGSIDNLEIESLSLTAIVDYYAQEETK